MEFSIYPYPIHLARFCSCCCRRRPPRRPRQRLQSIFFSCALTELMSNNGEFHVRAFLYVFEPAYVPSTTSMNDSVCVRVCGCACVFLCEFVCVCVYVCVYATHEHHCMRIRMRECMNSFAVHNSINSSIITGSYAPFIFLNFRRFTID